MTSGRKSLSGDADQRVDQKVDQPSFTTTNILLYMYFYSKDGAPTRTRTADLLITNQLLYQLSYRGRRPGTASAAEPVGPVG